jgi:hypothetical protein
MTDRETLRAEELQDAQSKAVGLFREIEGRGKEIFRPKKVEEESRDGSTFATNKFSGSISTSRSAKAATQASRAGGRVGSHLRRWANDYSSK